MNTIWTTYRGWIIGIATGFLVLCLACSGLSALASFGASRSKLTPTQESAPQADPTESPVEAPTERPQQEPTTTPPTVAPTVPPAVANRLSIVQMEAFITQVASDQYADSLSLLVGGFCDINVTACVASQTGNWTVTGPAVILTDPGHLALQGGVSIIKTWQLRTDWIFGVYYCPETATCTIPTPGRAAFLDAALPASLLH